MQIIHIKYQKSTLLHKLLCRLFRPDINSPPRAWRVEKQPKGLCHAERVSTSVNIHPSSLSLRRDFGFIPENRHCERKRGNPGL